MIQRNTCHLVPSALCFSMELMMAFGCKNKIIQSQPIAICSEFPQWSNIDYLSIWLFLVQCLGKHINTWDLTLHSTLNSLIYVLYERCTSSIFFNFYFKRFSLLTQLFVFFFLLSYPIEYKSFTFLSVTLS